MPSGLPGLPISGFTSTKALGYSNLAFLSCLLSPGPRLAILEVGGGEAPQSSLLNGQAWDNDPP